MKELTATEVEGLGINISAMHHIHGAISDDEEKVIVGFLSHDHDCQDPLAFDGNGEIVTAHKNSSVEAHRKFQKARGLDHHWSPDLSLVDDGSGLTDAQLMERWKKALERGEIGDPLAITLDIYEHSGTMYSLSGQGPQCQFDTARGAALWVPDHCARENILITALGKALKDVGIKEFQHRIGWSEERKSYCLVENIPDGVEIPSNMTRTENGVLIQGLDRLYDASLAGARLLCRAMGKDETKIDVSKHGQAVAREYAKVVIDEYNRWLAGDTWGRTVATFERSITKSHHISYVETNSDSCWGYIGTEAANEELESIFKDTCESLDQQMSPAMT